MNRLDFLCEYVFNMILFENKGFSSLPYKSSETINHLKKGLVDFAKGYAQERYDVVIEEKEWNLLADILAENINPCMTLSQGSDIFCQDLEENLFLIDTEFLKDFTSTPKIVVSRILGNFVTIKDQVKQESSTNYYLAKRFLPKKALKKVKSIDMSKITHKFVPGVRTLTNFVIGQKICAINGLAQFEVTEVLRDRILVKGPQGHIVETSPRMYRDNSTEILAYNAFNESIMIFDTVEVRVDKTDEAMKMADWPEEKNNPDWYLWAGVIRSHKATVIDIQGKFAIIHFMGENLGDFRLFDFRIHIDYLVGAKLNEVKPRTAGFKSPAKEEKKDKFEDQDRAAGPYNLDKYKGKLIKIVNFSKAYDNRCGMVNSVDNILGRIHITLEGTGYKGNDKLYFRGAEKDHLEAIEIVGDLVESNF